MLLFFSRRIGLTAAGSRSRSTPGARLTGRAGAYGVGLMTIQTDPDGRRAGRQLHRAARSPRCARDVRRRRDLSLAPVHQVGDYNRVYGADANFRFFRALSINGFLAKSETPGVSSGGEMSGKGSIVWNNNVLHTQYSLLSVGDNFRDDIGFVKRTGIRKHFADFGVRPGRRRCASTGSASSTRTCATTSTPISRTRR